MQPEASARTTPLCYRLAVLFGILANAEESESAESGSDGCPYVSITDGLRQVMEEAGMTRLHLSITNEDNYAASFIVVEKA